MSAPTSSSTFPARVLGWVDGTIALEISLYDFRHLGATVGTRITIVGLPDDDLDLVRSEPVYRRDEVVSVKLYIDGPSVHRVDDDDRRRLGTESGRLALLEEHSPYGTNAGPAGWVSFRYLGRAIRVLSRRGVTYFGCQIVQSIPAMTEGGDVNDPVLLALGGNSVGPVIVPITTPAARPPEAPCPRSGLEGWAHCTPERPACVPCRDAEDSMRERRERAAKDKPMGGWPVRG